MYDGECMLCRRFRSLVQLRRKVDITRYDMRERVDLVDHYQ
jgi:hypothetical protein